MTTSNRWKLLVGLLAIFCLLATACSSDDNSGSSSSDSADDAAEEDTDDNTDTDEVDGTTTTTTTTTPVSVGFKSADTTTCHPLGQLILYQLNDRCVEEWTPAALQAAGLYVWMDAPADVDSSDEPEDDDTSADTAAPVTCPAVVVAAPRELLVAGVSPDAASDGVVATTRALGGDPEQLTATAWRIHGVNLDEALENLDQLQGADWVVDLNYYNAVQPNDGFRPYDNPFPVRPNPLQQSLLLDATEQFDGDLLVLDSPVDPNVFDLDGNGYIDEDHGHGDFVLSIIQQYVRGPQPGLIGIRGQNKLSSGRWSPMMFSDADLIQATAVHGAADLINLSLGGAGCVETDTYGHGVGQHIALAMELRTVAPDALIVAAAGNHGADIHHFPAAWRAQGWGQQLIQDDLRDSYQDPNRLLAVGSVTSVSNPAVRSSFSNCGDWINVVAEGELQVGRYPDPRSLGGNGPPNLFGLAEWSGTSFATAHVTGQVAAEQRPTMVNGLPC